MDFALIMRGKMSKDILFLDECGFNLHESINCGYSPRNTDSLSFVFNSRGKNSSVCSIISINGLIHYRRIEGAYSTTEFFIFLIECANIGILNEKSV